MNYGGVLTTACKSQFCFRNIIDTCHRTQLGGESRLDGERKYSKIREWHGTESPGSRLNNILAEVREGIGSGELGVHTTSSQPSQTGQQL